MSDQLQYFKQARQELMRQIEITMKNKQLLENTLKHWQEEVKRGVLDAATYSYNIQQFLQGRSANEWNKLYNDHIKKCNQALAFYAGKINALDDDEDKGSVWFRIGAVGIALFIFFSFLALSDSRITGLFIAGQNEGQIVYEDGFVHEGTRWVELKGSRIYERCLKVESGADFDAVTISGKLTAATEQKALMFTLFTNYAEEPRTELGACRIKDYDSLWKSCTIANIKQVAGSYWICAAAPEGDQKQTYYTLAYTIGDNRKTALWTGQSWQKLEHISYTMKTQFIKHGQTP